MSKKAIDLHTRCEFIIIEKTHGNFIPRGSILYCGQCGKTLGQMSTGMRLPFSVSKFVQNIADPSFEVTFLGLTHQKCAMTMFAKKEQFEFITLEEYNREHST